MDQIQARTEELKERLKVSKARSACVGDEVKIAGELPPEEGLEGEVQEEAESPLGEEVFGEFCEGDIDLGTDESVVFMQVQGDESAVKGNAGKMGCAELTSGANAEMGEKVVCFPNEFLTEILMKNDDIPVAKVNPTDLEEASECKFGKTIAKSECTQGARQNAQTEIQQNIVHSAMSLGKGNLSYLGAATKNVIKEVKTQNFSGKSSMKLEYTPYKRSDGVPSISLTPEVEAMEKWKKCLVGYFIGVKLPFHIVKSEAFKRWRGEGLQRIAYTASGFYLLDFDDEKSRDKALDNGPIHIFGRALVLKKWHLMMSLSKETCDNIPIWVNFHNLPYEFWSGKSLGKIASVLGKPLYADQATENQTRVTFARVCIEIDAKEEKVETIRVECDGKSVDVEVKYQWYPLRCGDCKVFGHSISSCPVKAKAKEVMASKIGAQANNNPRKQESWKEVRRGKNEINTKGNPKEPSVTLRNSFDIMKGCEELDTTKETEQAINDIRKEANQKVKMLQHAAFSKKISKLWDEPAALVESSIGTLGSSMAVMEGKEKKLNEKSKLKDRKGNVLSLHEVKNSIGNKVEAVSPNVSLCEGVAMNPDSGDDYDVNPECDGSLFEAFGSKEEDLVMNSPTTKFGLSTSDYPSDWSKKRIKKAIRAVQLAGPPKKRDDPP